MQDRVDDIIAPAAIERAMAAYEAGRRLSYSDLVQTRKVLTEHVFGLIASGQTDEQALTVAGLTFLKSIEQRGEAGDPARESDHIVKAT